MPDKRIQHTVYEEQVRLKPAQHSVPVLTQVRTQVQGRVLLKRSTLPHCHIQLRIMSHRKQLPLIKINQKLSPILSLEIWDTEKIPQDNNLNTSRPYFKTLLRITNQGTNRTEHRFLIKTIMAHTHRSRRQSHHQGGIWHHQKTQQCFHQVIMEMIGHRDLNKIISKHNKDQQKGTLQLHLYQTVDLILSQI